MLSEVVNIKSIESYDLYHRVDNNYVIWCRSELMVIDLFIFPDAVEWYPYPHNTKFPFNEIEDAAREHYINK